MKRFTYFYFALIVILFSACNSCSDGNKIKSDDKTVDKDVVVEIQDSEQKIDEDEMKPDEKKDTETDDSDSTEKDEDEKYNPYADTDILYVYYGDYDVNAEDPENVRKLWAERYDYLIDGPTGCKPKPYDHCYENYPFEPILVEDMQKYECTAKRKEITSFSCDQLLTPPQCWHHGWVKGRDPKYNEHNGKVFFRMLSDNTDFNGTSRGSYLFDIKTKQLIRIANYYHNSWLNERYIFLSTYDDSENTQFDERPTFVEEYQAHLIYYDTKKRRYGYAWEKDKFFAATHMRASDTHIIISIQTRVSGGKTQVFYTKIGEWDKWKELTFRVKDEYGLSAAYYPDMKGQYVVFENYNLEAIYCDLEKGDSGCFKVSRDNEDIWFPKILNGKVYYKSRDLANPESNKRTMVEVDISNTEAIKHKELFSYDVEGERMNSINDMDERFILYSKQIGADESGLWPLSVLCFYRFKDGKSFCMDDERDRKYTKVYSFIWDKYVIYQSYQDIVLRDMECYCKKHPERCPYEEFTGK